MKSIYTVFLSVLALLCPPAFAGLVDGHFAGKSEKEIAEEFEQGLARFLKDRLTERVKPRIYMTEKREQVYLELTGVEEEESTWQTLVRYGWFEETTTYAFRPHGDSYTYKTADLPPGQIADWFDAGYRLPQEMVALAVWLADKNELTLANGKLAELAEVNERQREDIDTWLIEKHGWDAPEEGLTAVSHTDIRTDKTIRMLLTGEALEEYEEELDKLAKEMFEFIEDNSGGTKGKPGHRRSSPKVRLVVLKRWLKAYRESFMDTPFAGKKRNLRNLQELEEAIDADIEFIETEKFKAERKGIDDDWVAAAEHYQLLYRTDPKTPEVIQKAANAWSKAASISDAGRKCEDPKAAARAAKMYEELIEIYPLALSYRNNAGLNRLAAGDKRKAKAHHEYVVKATDDLPDMDKNQKGNREFAQRQLEVIG